MTSIFDIDWNISAWTCEILFSHETNIRVLDLSKSSKACIYRLYISFKDPSYVLLIYFSHIIFFRMFLYVCDKNVYITHTHIYKYIAIYCNTNYISHLYHIIKSTKLYEWRLEIFIFNENINWNYATYMSTFNSLEK